MFKLVGIPSRMTILCTRSITLFLFWCMWPKLGCNRCSIDLDQILHVIGLKELHLGLSTGPTNFLFLLYYIVGEDEKRHFLPSWLHWKEGSEHSSNCAATSFTLVICHSIWACLSTDIQGICDPICHNNNSDLQSIAPGLLEKTSFDQGNWHRFFTLGSVRCLP